VKKPGRNGMSTENRFETLRFAVAVLIAVFLSFIIILLISEKPFMALQKLFLGPLESWRRFGNVVELTITLSFTGLSIALMFSARQFNMGAEGSFYVGGAVAAMFALSVPLPSVLHPAAAILLGGLSGAVICAIPALLKGKWGASELVSSLMLNYVFFYLARYFVNTSYKDPNCGFVATYLIPESAKLSRILPGTRIHSGLFIAAATVALAVVFIKRTKWGYALIQAGRNAAFATYSGINTPMVIVYSQLLGGLVAGMGGAVEVLGMYDRFQWQNMPGYGFDGVIVAILARNKPKYVPIAAFFLAYLRIGADKMATATDVTSEMISIIQGIIIMLVAAQAFMASYKQKMLLKEAQIHG